MQRSCNKLLVPKTVCRNFTAPNTYCMFRKISPVQHACVVKFRAVWCTRSLLQLRCISDTSEFFRFRCLCHLRLDLVADFTCGIVLFDMSITHYWCSDLVADVALVPDSECQTETFVALMFRSCCKLSHTVVHTLRLVHTIVQCSCTLHLIFIKTYSIVFLPFV